MKIKSQQSGWKYKVAREVNEFLINFIYMAFFFGCFTWYRRLVLAEYHITYAHYGIAVLQALILAKVVMLGDMLGVGKKLEHKALLFSALYKTGMFTVWVGLFAILEHTLDGLAHDKGLRQSFLETFSIGIYEVLSRCLVVFVAFIPFFGIKETNRLFGKKDIHVLFLRKGSD